MKELIQFTKKVVKLKLWEDEPTMMHITLEDIEVQNTDMTIQPRKREDNEGKNPVVIHLPTINGIHFYIGQHVNISISALIEE